MIKAFLGRQALQRISGGKLSRPTRIQAIRRLPTLLRLGYALMRDSRVPLWQRAAAVSLVGLILSPIDLPGNIPVIGQFWDFTLAVAVLDTFIQSVPPSVVNEHIVRLGLKGKFPIRNV